MNKILNYFEQAYNELIHKVTWPTWPNLLDSARVVIIASVIIALVILAMDLIANTALGFIYNL